MPNYGNDRHIVQYSIAVAWPVALATWCRNDRHIDSLYSPPQPGCGCSGCRAGIQLVAVWSAPKIRGVTSLHTTSTQYTYWLYKETFSDFLELFRFWRKSDITMHIVVFSFGLELGRKYLNLGLSQNKRYFLKLSKKYLNFANFFVQTLLEIIIIIFL